MSTCSAKCNAMDHGRSTFEVAYSENLFQVYNKSVNDITESLSLFSQKT